MDNVVEINEGLYKEVEEYVNGKESSFNSVDEFVIACVRQGISKIKSRDGNSLSDDEEEKIKSRLESLGYL